MNVRTPIVIETVVHAPLEKVWECWTNPEHITQWAFASNDWEAPVAENDVRVGGRFLTTMSAKDESASFDFTGTYTKVNGRGFLAYTMDGDDARNVSVEFVQTPEGVKIIESFDPELENPEDMQRSGWQAILENFKAHVESEI